MAQTMIFLSWSTMNYPNYDMLGLLVPAPPVTNKHYNWCKENIPDRTKWYVNFNYPYYDVVLDDEDMTAFKLVFADEPNVLP